MAVSSTIKLEIYNAALGHLGSRELASLTENREPRRVMDRLWGTDNEVVKYALSRGEWNFALRTMLVDYNPSIEPGFGFARAFDKPDDCVRLAGMSADPYLRQPLSNNQYVDEASFWFADLDVLYVRYVSSDDDFGMDASKWSVSFKKFIGLHMAHEACERLTNSVAKKDRLQRDAMLMLKEARSSDAMQEGHKLLPHGSWSRARRGSWT